MGQLKKLNESSLTRLTMGHEKDGYCIISAMKVYGDGIPNNVDVDKEVAKGTKINDLGNGLFEFDRTKQLIDFLKRNGYSYLPVYGGYKMEDGGKEVTEKSFVVYPYDRNSNTNRDFNKFKSDMMYIASSSNDGTTVDQETILIKEPGKNPTYIYPNTGDVDMEFSDKIKYKDTDQTYFTAMQKNSPQRFSFESLDDTDTLLTCLSESLGEVYIDVPQTMMGAHSRYAKGEFVLPIQEFYSKTELQENSNKFRRMKRSLFGDPTGKIKTFAIISSENPLGWKDSTEEEFIKKYQKWKNNMPIYNKGTHSDLENRVEEIMHRFKETGKKALNYSRVSYAKIKGSYDETKENSYCLFNITAADARKIARDFGQESFFYGKVLPDKSEIAFYMTHDACKTYDLVEVTDNVTYEDEADDFFSKFGFKYSINLRTYNDELPEYTSEQDFEKSLSENASFLSRALHRPNPKRF